LLAREHFSHYYLAHSGTPALYEKALASAAGAGAPFSREAAPGIEIKMGIAIKIVHL
jgi:hypothetical protein